MQNYVVLFCFFWRDISCNLSDHACSEISMGNFVGMVMIDLRNAFDMVDFDVLSAKLTNMGVKSTDWF